MAISESQVEPQSIIMWGLRVRMAVATGAVEGVKVHYKSLVHGSGCNNKSWIQHELGTCTAHLVLT